MTPMLSSRMLSATLSCVGLAVTSCSQKPNHQVAISARADRFALTLRTEEIRGFCYAPERFLFNGSLDLSNFVQRNTWKIAPAQQHLAETLDREFSANRRKIGRNIVLTIKRDSVLIRPSYFFFTIFPCDAPTKSAGWIGGLHTVVGSADLPTFYPPDYRVKRSAEEERLLESEMMHNDAVPAKSK